MNPNAYDESGLDAIHRERQLRICEEYWHDKATQAIRDNRSTALWLVYRNRADFYYQLRVANIIY